MSSKSLSPGISFMITRNIIEGYNKTLKCMVNPVLFFSDKMIKGDGNARRELRKKIIKQISRDLFFLSDERKEDIQIYCGAAIAIYKYILKVSVISFHSTNPIRLNINQTEKHIDRIKKIIFKYTSEKFNEIDILLLSLKMSEMLLDGDKIIFKKPMNMNTNHIKKLDNRLYQFY